MVIRKLELNPTEKILLALSVYYISDGHIQYSKSFEVLITH